MVLSRKRTVVKILRVYLRRHTLSQTVRASTSPSQGPSAHMAIPIVGPADIADARCRRPSLWPQRCHDTERTLDSHWQWMEGIFQSRRWRRGACHQRSQGPWPRRGNVLARLAHNCPGLGNGNKVLSGDVQSACRRRGSLYRLDVNLCLYAIPAPARLYGFPQDARSRYLWVPSLRRKTDTVAAPARQNARLDSSPCAAATPDLHAG